MRNLIVTFLFLLCISTVKAQKEAIQIDSLKSLLQNTEKQRNIWVYCQNIAHLFNSDSLIIHSAVSTIHFLTFCDSDTISIISFSDGKALISEKSKNKGRITETFSKLNTYKTVFKKKRKSIIIVLKNYDNTFQYRLSEIKKNSIDLNYIIILVKEKNFH